jgi:formyl-CoA transferase/CoA:oxalate CoA-transferase
MNHAPGPWYKSAMLPLSDVLVLDLSRVLSGPYCSMYLADFGARVIKIERPGAGDDTRAFGPPFVGGESTYYLSINRNKESVALDLKSPEGLSLVRRLAGRADVLLENFRPGVMERLGLSYPALRQDNPRLIYCSISGFGSQEDRPGYDVVVQGMGGLPSLTGEPDGAPMKVGVSIADLSAGLHALCGILIALHARHRTGRGQHVDISMLDGQVALLTYHATMYLNAGVEPRRMGNQHPSIAPYETYRTADGFINIAAANDGLFRDLCQALAPHGLDPSLPGDPRFARNPDRVRNRAALSEILEPLLMMKPSVVWLSALEQAGIPCGPILSVPQLLSLPVVQDRQMMVSVPHPALAAQGGPPEVQVTGVPIRLSETPGAVRAAPPLLGQHTAALADLLGLTEEELRGLRQRGVIA